jgi:predicted flap endonuclease-1-like 5' DNA nuclease
MTFLAIHIPCWLIPILVGLISAILGYLLGKLSGGGSNDNDCEDRLAKLQAELDACKSSKLSLEGDLKSTKASLASFLTAATATLIPFDAAAAKAVFGKKIKENDLTIVEGIGPKIQELFHNHDVKTWKALSECSVDKCQIVLNSGGDRFKMLKPSTWPKQAKFAFEGKWQELLKWQDELDGGK